MKKQKIILCSNVNENEKLKSLASFGENTFDLHFMNTLDLAKYLLELSGVQYKQTFVKDDVLSAMLYTKIKAIEYFNSLSLNDIMNLITSINKLRHFILKDEDKEFNEKMMNEPVFEEKNKAVVEAYNLLKNYLNENNLIDEVGIIRYAYENTKSFPNIEFIIYKDSPLDYVCPSLDKALLDKAAGKVVEPTSIAEKKVNIKSYTKVFGQTNEIENIIQYIYQNHIPFDQCLIASAETTDYANILENYRDLIGFPVTIGIGKSVKETNPGKVFASVFDWEKSHFHLEYFKRLILNESFNFELLKNDIGYSEKDVSVVNKGLKYPELISFESIIETLGDLRICLDDVKNNTKLNDYKRVVIKYRKLYPDDASYLRRTKEMPFIERMVNILNQGKLYLINSYSLLNNSYDKNALAKIVTLLSWEKEFNISPKDINKTISTQTVSRQSPEAGKLYFTSISNASSCLRPYLFVVGLSSNNFPGGSQEDPMIIDHDYLSFGVPVDETSNKGIRDNKNSFFSLLYESNKYGIEVHLSYSYYNSQSLKSQNASSVLFDSYKIESGAEKTIGDFEDEYKNNPKRFVSIDEFFTANILESSKIGQSIVNGNNISFEKREIDTEEKTIELNKITGGRGLSASAINNYVTCPYLFFLSNVLHIPQPEDIDIYEVIPPNDYGTLAHLLLEHLDKKIITNKEKFADLAKQAMNDYFIIHQNDNSSVKEKAKEEFAETMMNAYEMEGTEEAVLKEEDNGCYHEETGLLIHGLPDKVIQHGKEYKIVDYKTGRSVKHFADEPSTMLQCVVYAYVLKKLGYNVTGFEYRYLRLNEFVRSGDAGLSMLDYENELNTILKRIKTSQETGNFKPNTDECSKCYYKTICVRAKK